MADTTSYIEMLRKFGGDLGLPRVNVDQLVETQRKESFEEIRASIGRDKSA
jgi:hypothetical protein